MESEENMPREPDSLDSNVGNEESQRNRDQMKSLEPVQVASLQSTKNEASIQTNSMKIAHTHPQFY